MLKLLLGVIPFLVVIACSTAPERHSDHWLQFENEKVAVVIKPNLESTGHELEDVYFKLLDNGKAQLHRPIAMHVEELPKRMIAREGFSDAHVVETWAVDLSSIEGLTDAQRDNLSKQGGRYLVLKLGAANPADGNAHHMQVLLAQRVPASEAKVLGNIKGKEIEPSQVAQAGQLPSREPNFRMK